MLFPMFLLAAVYGAVFAALVLAGVPVPYVALGAALVLLAQWWIPELLARRMTRAEFAGRDREPELHAALDRLCALADVPRPRLAVSPDPAPNAYTVGRSRRTTTVIVTRGLLERLDADELTAVLAHEIAHIRHRDVAVMTVASAFAIALAWIARGLGRVAASPEVMAETGPVIALALLAGMVGTAVASFAAHLPLRWLSRARELAADRAAAGLLGQPALLASALLKVHRDDIPLTDLRGVPAMGLVACHGRGGALMATHPPVRTRVRRLVG